MDVVITEWALDAYLDLKHQGAFSVNQFNETIRPDVNLLKQGLPFNHAKFRNSNFWGLKQSTKNLCKLEQ